MLKSIYNEKENIIRQKTENIIEKFKNNNCKSLDNNSIIFLNESYDNIYNELQNIIKDKSLNAHLVFNKLSLLNNNFIISI